MTKKELLEKLKEFLQIHGNTNILDPNEGALKMHILKSKNENKTPKQKLINYKLLRIDEKLLTGQEAISEKDLIISEFLIDELFKYYSKKKN